MSEVRTAHTRNCIKSLTLCLLFACRGNRELEWEKYETSVQYIYLDLDSNLLIQNTNLTIKACFFLKKKQHQMIKVILQGFSTQFYM